MFLLRCFCRIVHQSQERNIVERVFALEEAAPTMVTEFRKWDFCTENSLVCKWEGVSSSMSQTMASKQGKMAHS